MSRRTGAFALAATISAATLCACSPSTPFEALERGADAAAQCVRDHGYEPIGPDPGAAGIGLVVGAYVGHAPTDAEQEAIDETITACWDEHALDVEQAYLASLRVTGAEREAVFERFTRCLADAGVSGLHIDDPEERAGDLVEGNDLAILCLQEHLFSLYR